LRALGESTRSRGVDDCGIWARAHQRLAFSSWNGSGNLPGTISGDNVHGPGNGSPLRDLR
jgi:hypothetical protein